jgi:hypothetical protein
MKNLLMKRVVSKLYVYFTFIIYYLYNVYNHIYMYIERKGKMNVSVRQLRHMSSTESYRSMSVVQPANEVFYINIYIQMKL